MNKKKYLLLSLLLNLLFLGFSTEAQIFFAPKFSIYNGNILEHVWIPEESVNLSQLDWEIVNVPSFGFNLEVNTSKKYFAVDFMTSLPAASGNMQDYDWQNSKDRTELTNYSIHDNHLETFCDIKILLGLNLSNPALRTTFIPLLGINCNYINFLATDGYATYKSNKWVPIYFSGEVLRYSQKYFTFITGLKTKTTVFPHLNLELEQYMAVPFNVDAIDHHLVSSKVIDYHDKIDDGLLLKGSAGILYDIQKICSLGMRIGYEFIPTFYGNTYINDYTYPLSDLGGTTRNLWNITFETKFEL